MAAATDNAGMLIVYSRKVLQNYCDFVTSPFFRIFAVHYAAITGQIMTIWY